MKSEYQLQGVINSPDVVSVEVGYHFSESIDIKCGDLFNEHFGSNTKDLNFGANRCLSRGR